MNFKIIQNELKDENGDSNFGKKIVFEKIVLSHNLLKNIKSFIMLFFKDVSYVFQSTYSEPKVLELTLENFNKIINTCFSAITTKQKIFRL